MSEEGDWANHVPPDVLRCIASRLPIADFARFSAACKSWRSAAATSRHLAPRTPYLLIPGNGSDQGSADYCNLLNLADNRVHRVSTLPEIRGKRFVGSQDGWVITLDVYSNASLLNPLTRSMIHLPPITTLSHVDPVHDESGSLVMYSYHIERIWNTVDSPEIRTPEEFLRNSIRKVVLSSSPGSGGDRTVVAIFNFTGLILFIRPGDNKWVLLEEDEMDWFEDVICCNGRFLAVARSGYIVELDFASDPPRKILVAKEFDDNKKQYDSRYLVVDYAGDLLQVCRRGTFPEEGLFYITDNSNHEIGSKPKHLVSCEELRQTKPFSW